MAIQTSVRLNMPGGIEGQIAESFSAKTRSYINSTPEIINVTVTAADLSTTATINGTAYNTDKKTITITAADAATTATVNGTGYNANAGAGVATKTEIATELAAAIEAGESALDATLVGETVVVTQASGEYGTFTVVGTTNCSVAQTAVTTSVIASNIASVVNSNETTVVAVADSGVIELTSDIGVDLTAVGTTNCSVASATPDSQAIPFGRFVTKDPAYDERAHLPIAATDITNAGACAGFTIRNNTVENDAGAGYAVADQMEVVEQGIIYVLVENAVTTASGVYVRFTASGSEELGRVRSDNDGGDAALLPNARFLDGGAAGELVRLQINTP